MLDETKVTIIWQKITFEIRWMTLDILTLNIVLITVGKTVTLLLGYFQEKFYVERQLSQNGGRIKDVSWRRIDSKTV